MTTLERIIETVERMPEDVQQRVLNFVEAMSERHSAIQKERSGTRLLQFIGVFDKVSLQQMEEAIEDGCERIDWNEW